MTVLIADDSAMIRTCVARFIRARGITVSLLESANVEDTIAAIGQHQPEVLILDLAMPGGSGFDVLSHIRTKGYATRVLVLTNHVSNYYRRKSIELGAHCFLDKASEFDMVVDFLESECLEQGR